ncbi:hypothetical protein [Peptoniphilus hominis (ex Hitch et al. 2025)]|uniref:Copper amine oxidase N-terminal domain n=1 Tax=Peptoniphilus hominis (ex Hitch et al. 2025) TaxID=3133174 RepID=A0ABV1CCH8_9FIRM
MNKKITSLSLAGIMLLSTASPVFAAPEVKAPVKETTKAEEMVKDAKEAGKEIAKDAKEAMTDAKEKVEEKGKEAVKETKEVAKEVKEDAKEVKEEVKEKVESKDVKATTQKVKLDGKDVVIYGYNIDGYNYFKLRDLAAVLKDTKAKFGVEYKDAMVTLTKGADYKVAETDQKEVKAESKGMLTNDKVMVGDKALTATSYKVDDSNYYKLRDLGEALGFGVDFDKATNTVLLMSEKEAAKEEKVAPKIEELKEAVKKELVNEKEVRESEAYKKADDKVKSNFENAVAAAKSLLDDEKATAEQFENELKALVEAKEQLGFKADVKVEEKKEDKKEVKDEKKDDKKEEVKETK